MSLIALLLFLIKLLYVNSQEESLSTLRISRSYYMDSYKENLYLYRQNHSEIILIDSFIGRKSISSTENRTYSVVPGIYRIQATDNQGYGWYFGSFFEVFLDDQLLLSDRLDEGSTKEWLINTKYFVAPNSTWRYTNIAQYNNHWYLPSYSDHSWATYSHGNFPDISSISRYYRTSFIYTEEDMKDVFIIKLNTFIKEGIIIYINGKEIIRYNMNKDQVITPTNYAIIEDNYYHSLVYSIPISILELNNNNEITIAIEIHTAKHVSIATDLFNFSFLPLQGIKVPQFIDSSPIVFSGMCTSPLYIMDHNIKSEWICTEGTSCSLEFHMPDYHFDFIQQIEIISSSSIDLIPLNLLIQASIDDCVTLSPLLYIPNEYIYDYNRIQLFNITTTTEYYNCISIQIISSKSNEVSISEIHFYATSIIYDEELKYNKKQSLWPISHNILLYPLLAEMNHFVIMDKTLPNGLTLEETSGIITGKVKFGWSGSIYLCGTFIPTSSEKCITLEIKIEDCMDSLVSSLFITKNSDSTILSNERVSIYTSDGELVYSIQSNYNKPSSHQLCLYKSTYYILLESLYTTEWGLDSSLYIEKKTPHGSIPILKTSLIGIPSKVIPLYLNELISVNDENTLCFYTVKTIPPFWYYPEYKIDENWNYCYDQNNIILPATCIHLFRNTFKIDNMNEFSSVEIRYNGPKAMILYVNKKKSYNQSICSQDTLYERYITLNMTYFYVSKNNLMAIAFIYHPDDSSHFNISSWFSVVLIPSTEDYSRVWGINIEGKSDSNHTEENLLDYKRSTYWTYNYHSLEEMSTILIYTLIPNEHTEVLNHYCIINNPLYKEWDPISWYIYGCIDKDSCEVLSYVDNIYWSKRSEKLCFSFEETISPIQIIKIEFPRILNTLYFTNPKCSQNMNSFNHSDYSCIINNKYNNNVNTNSRESKDISKYQNIISISSIYFSHINVNTNPYLPFQYPSSHYIFYRYITISPIYPNSGYQSYSIFSGELPEGIFLDQGKGILYGNPVVFFPLSNIQIKAYNQENQEFSLTLSIEVIHVPKPYFYLHILIVDHYPSNENSNNHIQYELINKDYNNTVIPLTTLEYTCYQRHTYAILKGHYIFYVHDQYNKGLPNTSLHLYTTLYNEFLIIPSINTNYSENSFYLDHFNDDIDIEWTYLNDLTISAPLTTSWTEEGYNYNHWNKGTVDTIGYIQGITQYFVSDIPTPVNIYDFASLSFRIATKGGFQLYLNGILLYTYNMNIEEPITSETEALSSSTLLEYVQFAIPLSAPISRDIIYNRLAIEYHSGPKPSSIPYYSVLYDFIENHTYSVHRGKILVKDSLSIKETIPYLMDNDIHTEFLSESCESTKILYIYPQHVEELITNYSIINGDSCNIMTPSSWILEGSNDMGKTYIPLHYIEHNMFTAPLQEHSFSFYTISSFNLFRFTILSCSNQPFSTDNSTLCNSYKLKIADIRLFSDDILPYPCYPDKEGWSVASPNTFSFKSCPDHYNGYLRRFCSDQSILSNTIIDDCQYGLPTYYYYYSDYYIFQVDTPILSLKPLVNGYNITFKVTPNLPDGLSLDTSTGIISGIPLLGSLGVYYTFSVIHVNTTILTTIYIEVTGTKSRLYCLENEEWPITYKGLTVVKPCEPYMIGNYSRQCIPQYYPEWSPVYDTCEYPEDYVQIYYNQTSYSIPINNYSEISPIVNGTVFLWSIFPETLPSGLQFINGTIQGTPSQPSDTTLYTIIASGLNVVTIKLKITVVELFCPQEGRWPITAQGKSTTISCNSELYNGFLWRLCSNSNPPLWNDAINMCLYKSPLIVLPTLQLQIEINSELASFIPECIGYCSYWTLDGILPQGLLFNSTNGNIEGKPSESISKTEYKLCGNNPDKKKCVSFTIEVINICCEEEGEWKSTSKGTIASLLCNDDTKEGSITRQCTNESPPLWLSPEDHCYYKTPIISYMFNEYQLTRGVSMDPIIPSFINIVNSWSIIPPLPMGMTIETYSGIIKGIPLYISQPTDYTITARNSDKETSIHLNLSVIIEVCPQDEEWNETEIQTLSYLFCNNNIPSYRSRSCSYINKSPVWMNESTIFCDIDNYNRKPKKNFIFYYIPIILSSNTTNEIKPSQLATLYKQLYSQFYSYLNQEISLEIRQIQEINNTYQSFYPINPSMNNSQSLYNSYIKDIYPYSSYNIQILLRFDIETLYYSYLSRAIPKYIQSNLLQDLKTIDSSYIHHELYIQSDGIYIEEFFDILPYIILYIIIFCSFIVSAGYIGIHMIQKPRKIYQSDSPFLYRQPVVRLSTPLLLIRNSSQSVDPSPSYYPLSLQSRNESHSHPFIKSHSESSSSSSSSSSSLHKYNYGSKHSSHKNQFIQLSDVLFDSDNER
ncbi:hypothetical protein WA158_004810 [Blastocystis sp. Blastoise]